jgi:predicted transcriptional regulator
MELTIKEPEEILKIAEALSVISRINILKLINNKPMSVTELTSELGMSKGNISNHIATLENAGLVVSEYENGIKGIKKIVKPKYSRIVIDLSP